MKATVRRNTYLLVFVIIANIISSFVFFRVDFTSNKRYSLSKVSQDIIKKNKEPIVIDLYVSEDLPPQLKKAEKEFVYLIKEYRSLSNSYFNFNIIHPDNLQKSSAAISVGIQPQIMEVMEHGNEKLQRIYLGAVIKIGDYTKVIPFIDQAFPLEYEITRFLTEVVEPIKPHIAFAAGHREASFPEMHQLMDELSHLFHIHITTISKKDSLEKYDVICIISPQEGYNEKEKELLNNYLDQGGCLFIALNHAVGNIGRMHERRNIGFINTTGLEEFLEKKGLKIQHDFVIDNNCGTIIINQQNGIFSSNKEVSFPYLPIISNFSKHTITQGLSSILLPFASSIQQTKTNTAYIFTPLATTSSFSGTQQAPISFNLQKQWNRNDFNKPYSVVAALLSNEDNNSAIVAITNASFLINDIRRMDIRRPDNINFAINSIEWLADNSGLISLRNKYASVGSIKTINNTCKKLIKNVNFFLPLILISIFVFIKNRRQKKLRMKRSRPGYID